MKPVFSFKLSAQQITQLVENWAQSNINIDFDEIRIQINEEDPYLWISVFLFLSEVQE